MTTCHEAYFRESGIGEQTSGQLIYFTFGESNEVTAHADCLVEFMAAFPNGYRGMPLRSTRIVERINETTYKITFDVGNSLNQVQPSVITEDAGTTQHNVTTTFTTQGGTVHVTNSLEIVDHAVRPGVTYDAFGGAIGVEHSGDKRNCRVRGVDIVAPLLEWSESTQFANAVVEGDSYAYVHAVKGVTGKVNNAPWRGYDAGTVLFRGVSGTKRGQDRWELSFAFVHSENKTGIVIDGLPAVDKEGWDLLDITNDPQSSSGNAVTVRPSQVRVHRVYERADFTLLKLGS